MKFVKAKLKELKKENVNSKAGSTQSVHHDNNVTTGMSAFLDNTGSVSQDFGSASDDFMSKLKQLEKATEETSKELIIGVLGTDGKTYRKKGHDTK